MAVFDELNDDLQELDVPEDRQAKSITRGNKKAFRKSEKSTSVSLAKYNTVMALVWAVIAIVVVSVCVYAIYYGLKLFIGG